MRIAVGEDDFDVSTELASLAGRGTVGGIGCFIGTVRGEVGDRTLTAMTLEQYPGMTERAITRIAAQATARWHLIDCTVIHRVGRLTPGAQIVLVLAAATHREAALAATGFLIDWLKTRAPLWKREEFTDGTEQWVAAREEDEKAAEKW